jgi:hypothetical protein
MKRQRFCNYCNQLLSRKNVLVALLAGTTTVTVWPEPATLE